MKIYLSFVLGLVSLSVSAAPPPAAPAVTYYADEATHRYLKVGPGSFGKLSLNFTMIGSPGSVGRWAALGEQHDKLMTFSAVTGEDQPPGTVFLGKGEGKLEITVKPGQKEPQDPGITGAYRHVSDERCASFAKKDHAAAEALLATSAKAAAKAWSGASKAVLSDWKAAWPSLRDRSLNALFKAPAAPASAGPGPLGKPPAPPPVTALAEYWFALTQVVGQGCTFLSAPLTKSVPKEWDGEYDDGFGGHVSLSLQKSGRMHATLSSGRSPDGEGSTLEADIPADKITTNTKGELTAEFVDNNPDAKTAADVAHLTLRRVGHFLYVERQGTPAAAGKAWFEGIYRWGPVPPPQ